MEKDCVSLDISFIMAQRTSSWSIQESFSGINIPGKYIASPYGSFGLKIAQERKSGLGPKTIWIYHKYPQSIP